MQKVTHHSEAVFKNHGGADWVEAHRKRKWRFAAKMATATDGRWTTRLLDWKPAHGIGREVGRPLTRWKDDLCHYAGDEWVTHAGDAAFWRDAEDGFVSRL